MFTPADFPLRRKERNGSEYWMTRDFKYMIHRHRDAYVYPCMWFYDHLPRNEASGNFWCSMVNTSYGYSFSMEQAIEVLNKELSTQ